MAWRSRPRGRRVPMVHRDKTGAAPLTTGDELENPVEEPTLDTVVPSMTEAGGRRVPMVHRDKTGAAPLATGDELENPVEEPTLDTVVPSMTEAGGRRVPMVHRDKTGAAPLATGDELENPVEESTLDTVVPSMTEAGGLRVSMVHRDKTGAAPLATGDELENPVEEPTLDTVVPSMTEAGAPQAKSKLHNIQFSIADTPSIIVSAEKTVGAILDASMIALAQELLEQCDDMVKMGSSILNFQIDNRKLAGQLSMIGKEVDNAKNETILLKAALEDSMVHRRKLEESLLYARTHASAKKRKMEEDKRAFNKLKVDYSTLNCFSLEIQRKEQFTEMKKRDLEHECATIRQELLEEKEKGLCQICVESPKDTMCLPCLHFHYCSNCVETHRRQSRTCPLCRTILSGTLKIDISVQS